MATRYLVKEIFPTIQGEGFHVGMPAVFVRMGGCNMWSGHDKDRERDAKRNGAECPRWCDTDFVGGLKKTAEQIANEIAFRFTGQPLVVFTGGEPFLQVDELLLGAVQRRLQGRVLFCFETNGTTDRKFVATNRWIAMSPKVPRKRLVLDHADEIKIPFPAYDPAEWDSFPAQRRYVQPVDGIAGSLSLARDYVLTHPAWCLSVQTHKVAGFR